jgi:hypothetical protein
MPSLRINFNISRALYLKIARGPLFSYKEKAVLRHQNLKIIGLHLGRVSDSEAIRWMDILHGK